ncbi:MAG: hypothetical protein WCH46_01270 [bacterium]
MRQLSIISVAALLVIAGLSFSSCGESAKDKAERVTKDSIHRFDSLIKPRKEIYDAAVGELKELLKAPSTAKIPVLTLSNDTVKIKSTDTKAYVVFPYDAQNPMGTYMHDIATVKLVKNNGKWVAADRYYSLNASAPSMYWKEFDQYSDGELKSVTDLSNGAIPMPTPAPAPAPVPAPH